MASFLRPGENISTSGAAERRTLSNFLASEVDHDKGLAADTTEADEPVPQEAAEKASNALANFRDVEAILEKERCKKKSDKKKNSEKRVCSCNKKLSERDDGSSDESSEDDGQSDGGSDDDGFAKYCDLSPKVRQIIHHQGGK